MLKNFIISRIKAELPFEPNEEKEGLFEQLGSFLESRDEQKAFLLCGYAGTGKTSVVSALVRAMTKLEQPTVLLAPTGRAAKVLARYSGFPAFTIHKFIYRQDQLGGESFSLADNKLENTLFIVDEASMIAGIGENTTFGTGNLLDDLIQFVYNGKGCSLLLLGDNAQLPPVGSEQSPALEIKRLEGYGLSVYHFTLRQVARQALDSGILRNATNIRELLSAGQVAKLPTIETGDDVVEVQSADLVDSIEKSYREVGAEETIIITRSNWRTNMFNQGVRSRILWREDKVENGDRIMVVKNNYYQANDYDEIPFIANGDMFEIERVRNEREMYGFHFIDANLRSVDYRWDINALLWLDTLTTDTPEKNYELQKTLFSRIAEDYPEIRNRKELVKRVYESPYYNALQIRFAYAVTCHKAQGGQWKHVYLDRSRLEGGRETMRWLYTALTRATEKVFLL